MKMVFLEMPRQVGLQFLPKPDGGLLHALLGSFNTSLDQLILFDKIYLGNTDEQTLLVKPTLHDFYASQTICLYGH